MKKIDLGQTIGILANIGVIAGIVFLGFELRQNNDNLAAQSRYNHATAIAGLFHSFASDSELSAILLKARYGEQLNRVEEFQLDQTYRRVIVLMQWEYVEEKLGRTPSPTESWISILRECPREGFIQYPGIRSVWEATSDLWDDEFVAFINDSPAVDGCA